MYSDDKRLNVNGASGPDLTVRGELVRLLSPCICGNELEIRVRVGVEYTRFCARCGKIHRGVGKKPE
jgi:hypothetical protein